jgi:hypothetical protein
VPHFQQFLGELELRASDREDAEGKALRVAKALFARYYRGAAAFNPNCYRIVGSYGKNSAARPRTDIDMIFILSPVTFSRINAISSNKQSYLLQEVKNVLLESFPNTDIRGDGPVVKIPFSSYEVELVPCFAGPNGTFQNAHTKNGGRWALSNPNAELAHLNQADAASNGMARHLIKMLKAWKQQCNVDMRSVCLEIAAVVFIEQWEHKTSGIGYYDFMIRDFFQFLLRYAIGGSAKPAGINEWIPLSVCWQSKAQNAYERACMACNCEQADNPILAVPEWKKIFGEQFRYSPLARLLSGLPL